ncbi:hypothetical protein [Nesterenkonia sphaerica]|uniref:Uncharacterized protein n=1 Tax=Nesterenkonia sphaerica TaxID=1804988 RepID=A0A5R9A9A1_9MICC|nr:hypothetical protein [Nesterenkonia sphaerica]TLP75329.1 hypothetical protein FEF27_08425 [Nesterenkonia sphaerica]
MRFVYAIIAFVAGLALLGLGINQLTAETEETYLVETEGAEDAPFTVVTNDVIDTDAGREEFTIEAEGEYLIALGRTYDVEAWLDDAAHNRVTGFESGDGDEETARITAEYIDGETDVPDPTESDLWVSVETAEGEMPYRWDTPDEQGEWALLIYREGDEPAPAAITTTETLTISQTGGIALLVSGALVILLALGLFYWAAGAPRRRRNAEATATASAATAAPAAAQTPAGLPEEEPARLPDEDITVDQDPVPGPDEDITVDQDPVPGPAEDDLTQEFVPAWAAQESTGHTPAAESPAEDHDDEYEDDSEDPDSDDSDSDDSGSAGTDSEDHDSPDDSSPSAPKASETNNSERLSGWATGLRDRLGGGGKTSFAAGLAGMIALTSAVGLAGPAHAEEDAEADEEGEVQQDDPADVDPEELEEDNGAEEETGVEGEVPSEGYSVLLSSQLERIMEDIASTVEAADEELDADLLEDRVAADALNYRELAYRNNELADTSMPTPIGTEVLSAAVTGESDFPRQAVVIVEHPDAEVPQVLIIEQAAARENYKLVHTAMMAPGTEFPAVSAEQGGVSVVSPGETDDSGSPASALQGVSRWFVDQDHDFGEQMAESVYIDALHDYHDELTEAADDTVIEFADPEVDLDNASAVELPDGSVVVAGSFDMTMEMAPIRDGDTIFLEHDLVVEIVGTDWTTFPTRITSREFIVVQIPPEDSEDDVVLVGVDNLISDAEINTPEWFDGY